MGIPSILPAWTDERSKFGLSNFDDPLRVQQWPVFETLKLLIDNNHAQECTAITA